MSYIIKNRIISIIMIVTLIIIFMGFYMLSYGNNQIIKITVKDKYVKGKEGTYMIVDTNNNTYEISDLLFIGKFNSTDIYNEMTIGDNYTIETVGYRIRIISNYQNINKVFKEEK